MRKSENNFVEVGSLLLPCGSWESNSVYRTQKCWKKVILVSHKHSNRKKVTLARQVPSIKGAPWPKTGMHRQERLWPTWLAKWTKGRVWSSWGKSRHWVKGHFTRFGKFMECLLLTANYLWNSNNKKIISQNFHLLNQSNRANFTTRFTYLSIKMIFATAI